MNPDGPLTVYEVAAVHYRDQWAWPAFAHDRSVWLVAGVDLAGIEVVAALAQQVHDRLCEAGIDGPVIGDLDGRRTFLAHCDRLRAPHLLRNDETIMHHGYRSMIDLPPTSGLVWVREPAADLALPDCAVILNLVDDAAT